MTSTVQVCSLMKRVLKTIFPTAMIAFPVECQSILLEIHAPVMSRSSALQNMAIGNVKNLQF